MEPKPSPAEPKPARPVSERHPVLLWILFFGFAYLSITGWVRLIASLLDWDGLIFAGVWPGPLYLALSGALWGLIGLTGVIWLWLRRRWARLASMGVALLFGLSYWFDRLLLYANNREGNNLVFAAGATLLGWLYAAYVLSPWGELRALFKKTGSLD